MSKTKIDGDPTDESLAGLTMHLMQMYKGNPYILGDLAAWMKLSQINKRRIKEREDVFFSKPEVDCSADPINNLSNVSEIVSHKKMGKIIWDEENIQLERLIPLFKNQGDYDNTIGNVLKEERFQSKKMLNKNIIDFLLIGHQFGSTRIPENYWKNKTILFPETVFSINNQKMVYGMYFNQLIEDDHGKYHGWGSRYFWFSDKCLDDMYIAYYEIPKKKKRK